jgi:hypothetical protein
LIQQFSRDSIPNEELVVITRRIRIAPTLCA